MSCSVIVSGYLSCLCFSSYQSSLISTFCVWLQSATKAKGGERKQRKTSSSAEREEETVPAGPELFLWTVLPSAWPTAASPF